VAAAPAGVAEAWTSRAQAHPGFTRPNPGPPSSLTVKMPALASTATTTALSTGTSLTQRVAARSTLFSVLAPVDHLTRVRLLLQPQGLLLLLALWHHQALSHLSPVLLDARPHGRPSTRPRGQLLVQRGPLVATQKVMATAAAHTDVVMLGPLMLPGGTTRSVRFQSAKTALLPPETVAASAAVEAQATSYLRTAVVVPLAARATP
jgi:hypothetical protein